MNTITVISKVNMKITDVIEVTNFSVECNMEYSGKITATVFRKPVCEQNDYVLLQEAGKVLFMGICETVENASDQAEHTINIMEMCNMFDRKIILKEEALVSTQGIEDFIKKCIMDNYMESKDTFLNLEYLEVKVLTHTPIHAAVEAENDIYNFKTYLVNVLSYYGVYLDFAIKESRLVVTIAKQEQEILKIDATVTDITGYEESYKVEALTKLTVLWKIPDTEENGVVTVGAKTEKNYFLLADRSISEDMSSQNRAAGKSDTIYIEAESLEKVYEEVVNQFKSNSYEHSVEADIREDSLLYPREELYVGHECLIKTRSHGIQPSIISSISYDMGSSFLHVKFGNMKITLIEKLREAMK